MRLAADLSSIPVASLAAGPPPQAWHDSLRSRGPHCRDGEWIVAGPADVPAALGSADLRVVAPPLPPGPASALLARMARFSEGDDHRMRRQDVLRLLPPAGRLAREAGAQTRECLRRRSRPFDIMPAARTLPARVLAAGLGLGASAAAQAAELTGRLCDGIAAAAGPAGPDAAAAGLLQLLSGAGHDCEAAVAIASILFQARDATAALIGLMILAGAGDEAPSPDRRAASVLRSQAPVQNTRRVAVTGTHIGGAAIPAGAAVWVFVATAERGGPLPATFGAGPHACPGAAQAVAIARQVVAVLEADGWRPLGRRGGFEPRPNLRMPARLLVGRS